MGAKSKKSRTSKSLNETFEPIPSTSTQSQSGNCTSPPQTQKPRKGKRSSQSIGDKLSQNSLDEYVNNCVRYLILKAKADMPIRKNEIVENVLSDAGKVYEIVIAAATRILLDVYGFELKYCDQISGPNKMYFLNNMLPSLEDPHEKIDGFVPHQDKILVLLILSHILMSNGAVSENSLFAFFKAIKIDPEYNHPVFGNITNALKNLQKKKYVSSETVSNITMYDWGPRAEATVSKHELLKFVCKLYGNKSPEMWPTQFTAASNQFASHNEEDEQTSNDDFSD